MRLAASIGLALASVLPISAQTWRPMGPPGGDVRSFGADPNDFRRIFLGASDGHVFVSQDAVVTVILMDPRDARVLYAAAWTQNLAAGGGVFRSDDGGHTWRPSGLIGQAVRALAQAPSNPDVLIAGTLDGVYRSRDAGKTWERIS